MAAVLFEIFFRLRSWRSQRLMWHLKMVSRHSCRASLLYCGFRVAVHIFVFGNYIWLDDARTDATRKSLHRSCLIVLLNMLLYRLQSVRSLDFHQYTSAHSDFFLYPIHLCDFRFRAHNMRNKLHEPLSACYTLIMHCDQAFVTPFKNGAASINSHAPHHGLTARNANHTSSATIAWD